jgi:hypothetical protein
MKLRPNTGELFAERAAEDVAHAARREWRDDVTLPLGQFAAASREGVGGAEARQPPTREVSTSRRRTARTPCPIPVRRR